MIDLTKFPKAVLKDSFVLAVIDEEDGDEVVERSELNAGDEVYLLGIAFYQDAADAEKGNVYIIYSAKHHEATTMHECHLEEVTA